MRRVFILLLMICAVSSCLAESRPYTTRPEAEYYVNAYAATLSCARGIGARHCRARVELARVRCLPEGRRRAHATHADDCSAIGRP